MDLVPAGETFLLTLLVLPNPPLKIVSDSGIKHTAITSKYVNEIYLSISK